MEKVSFGKFLTKDSVIVLNGDDKKTIFDQMVAQVADLTFAFPRLQPSLRTTLNSKPREPRRKLPKKLPQRKPLLNKETHPTHPTLYRI